MKGYILHPTPGNNEYDVSHKCGKGGMTYVDAQYFWRKFDRGFL